MKISIILLMLALPLVTSAKTYEIVEKDFVETAKSYAETEEFRAKIREHTDNKIKALENLQGVSLLPAEDNETYSVEYLYTLPIDIPKVDLYGNITGILYPKGYTFRPLLYLPAPPPPIIVFNPCDIDEKRFVDSYIKTLPDYMLSASGCPLKDIRGYKQLVYLTQPEMVETFRLKNTVSIISVDTVAGVFNVHVIKVKN